MKKKKLFCLLMTCLLVCSSFINVSAAEIEPIGKLVDSYYVTNEDGNVMYIEEFEYIPEISPMGMNEYSIKTFNCYYRSSLVLTYKVTVGYYYLSSSSKGIETIDFSFSNRGSGWDYDYGVSGPNNSMEAYYTVSYYSDEAGTFYDNIDITFPGSSVIINRG